MKRIMAIALIIAAALCGCAQRYDGSQPGSLGAELPIVTPVPEWEATEASPIQPQPSLDAHISGGVIPARPGDIRPTPGPTAEASAIGGPRLGDAASSGVFPMEDIINGIMDEPVEDGQDVRAGKFSLVIPKYWKATENYETDDGAASVDGIFRFTNGKDRMVMSAIDIALYPLDLDDEFAVARIIDNNTDSEWIKYVSHQVVETPLGPALFIQASISEDPPVYTEEYAAITMVLPMGDQALNLAVSTPAASSDLHKSEMWRLLGRLAGAAIYTEDGGSF